jgi:PAS domain S-box-containing protein
MVLGVIVDISARKAAETHLAQMESKYRGLLEAAPDAMVVVNQSGEIVLLNVQAEKQFGYPRDELLGQNVANIIPEGFSERLAADRLRSLEDALEQRIGTGIELIGQRKEGSEFPIEIMLSPLETADGILVTAAIRDISVRRNAETHLEQMEARYRGLLEAAPDAMVVVNESGTIVLLNFQAEKRFGYPRDELLGQPVTNIIPEGFSERLRADALRSTEDALQQQIGTGIELLGRRKDGSEFPIEIMLSPLQSAEGLLVTAAIRDISVRRHVERLKDEFVSTVSHELRTPMTSISGSLSLLVGQWASVMPGSAARLLTIANKNSQRLVRLINDILDIEKLEAGRVVFNMSRVQLLPLVKQMIEANRSFAEGYSVNVRLEAISADADVSADSDRLAQVITNLLSNAVKFSPAGEEVLVAIVRNGEMVRLSVRDHGCGIPADFRPHVFEKFAQADATSSKQKGGTGLGLSIVKQIVERLRGDIGFEDAPGGGAIFYVDLPPWEGAAGWEIDQESDASSLRVLICEDDYETATALRKQLRSAGFAADLAFTIAAARLRAEASRYAALLIDLQLPDGDGVSLISSLRSQPQYKDTPVVVMSLDPIRGRDDVRSAKLNVLSWFSKPVDFQHLALVLNTSIASHAHKRPCILHVDDDRNLLSLVAHAFSTVADVISADSLKSARRAIASNHIDMALLDISIGATSGLDLLPDLRNDGVNPIPVIILSAHEKVVASDGQVEVVLTKSQASLKSLVELVCNRLARLPAQTPKEVA